MPEDIAKELKAAIRHRISCLDQPTLNGFAGTGRWRKRETQLSHTIARRIVDEALPPFSFRWDFGNFEPAGRVDIYLTVFTALFDIDDEDARRWTDKSDWDAARDEAAREIVRALMRKFMVAKRRVITESAGADGPVGGAHSISHSRYEDEMCNLYNVTTNQEATHDDIAKLYQATTSWFASAEVPSIFEDIPHLFLNETSIALV